ncbi:MAG TPA: hypothetical protein VMU76_07840 [Acidimicrobiales bacterium]|nr:hypothetical protein [Acidimicrobiales bacterium]
MSVPREPSRDGWERELADMAAHLVAQGAAFAAGHRATEPPVRRLGRTEDLGPLPERLRPRAEALLVATRALEGAVSEARASLVVAIRQAERSGRRAAAYVDASA